MTATSSDEDRGPLKPVFDNILNFRDVGETVNAFSGRRYDLSVSSCRAPLMFRLGS